MKTHLNDLFDKMEREKGNVLDDRIKVEEDLTSKEIYAGYERIKKFDINKLVLNQILNVFLYSYTRKHTADEITKFSMCIDSEKNDYFIGLFINYLIQQSEDKNHIIYSNENAKLDRIGTYNKKNILVHGSLCDNTGFRMYEGKIHVNGDCGFNTGYEMYGGKIEIDGSTLSNTGYYMINGEIIVRKNAEEFLGFGMDGGKIIVKGDAGEGLGKQFINGEIYVDGEIKSISSTYRGSIYHKGRKIVDKGKVLDESYAKW